MADEPLENEELELDEDLEESEEPKKSGGGLKTGLIIVVAQAVVAYFLATMVIVPMLVKDASASETKPADTSAVVQEVQVDSNFVNIGPIFNVEDIIVNPANSDGERYVVLNLALELSSEDAQAEIEKRVPIIRDVAIQLLSSVPVDSMDGAENKMKLKERFTQEVKKVLPPGTLRRVFFTSFIIQ